MADLFAEFGIAGQPEEKRGVDLFKEFGVAPGQQQAAQPVQASQRGVAHAENVGLLNEAARSFARGVNYFPQQVGKAVQAIG